MIKFFRKIRENLLAEGNLKNYFVYAIGEIFLVMVGILLALQVNTWNENRKAGNQETQILKDIKSEFLANQNSLNFSIERVTSYRDRCSGLLQYSGKDVSNLTRQKSDSLIFGLRIHTSVELNSYHIRELLNTGRINLINNDSLKLVLSNWEQNLAEYTEYEKLIYQENSSIVIPFLIENHSLASKFYEERYEFKSKFRNNYRRVYGLKTFENVVIRKLSLYNRVIRDYKQLVKITNTIVRITNEELAEINN